MLTIDIHRHNLTLLVFIADRWKNKIGSYHDVLLEREKHKSDESRRCEQSSSNSDLLGFEGTFRKLEID